MRDFSELREIYGDQDGSPWKLHRYEHFIDNGFLSASVLDDNSIQVLSEVFETVRIEMIAEGYQTEKPRMYGMHKIGGFILIRQHIKSSFDSDDKSTRFTITFSVKKD